MKFFTIILLFIAMFGLSTANPPNKDDTAMTCEGEDCSWCCSAIAQCISVCSFFYNKAYCRAKCRPKYCEGENGKDCKDKCQLNYCNETGVGDIDAWPQGNYTTDGTDATEEFNATEIVKAAKDIEASEATTLVKSVATHTVDANA